MTYYVVSQLCLSKKYLAKYRSHLKGLLDPKQSVNKLRDVENEYVEGGHLFSLNGELIFSFDVCGNCESHAMLFSMEKGLARDVSSAKTLDELDKSLTKGIKAFANCPK